MERSSGVQQRASYCVQITSISLMKTQRGTLDEPKAARQTEAERECYTEFPCLN